MTPMSVMSLLGCHQAPQTQMPKMCFTLSPLSVILLLSVQKAQCSSSIADLHKWYHFYSSDPWSLFLPISWQHLLLPPQCVPHTVARTTYIIQIWNSSAKSLPVPFSVTQSSGLWSLLFLWLYFQCSPPCSFQKLEWYLFFPHTAGRLSLQVTSRFATWKALSTATHMLSSTNFCSNVTLFPDLSLFLLFFIFLLNT